jgi:hypothetical protein
MLIKENNNSQSVYILHCSFLGGRIHTSSKCLIPDRLNEAVGSHMGDFFVLLYKASIGIRKPQAFVLTSEATDEASVSPTAA